MRQSRYRMERATLASARDARAADGDGYIPPWNGKETHTLMD